jgi:eukaryotic-like serine/threonine-protein kinase
VQSVQIIADDDLLTALCGVTVAPNASSGVRYKIDRVLGAGSFALAFFAFRSAPEGEAPVVLKVVRPRMMREAGETALLTVQKETAALRRLNERVPPTPFVVRLVDSDVLRIDQNGTRVQLPWIALEYVHGGAEGTTLDERVDFSVDQTGYAFDADRAALALTCLASGLEAIHEVGVVHRDLTPWNVLCSGFGADELFKIADFGIARPPRSSVQATFIGSPGGTPGYAAPEQIKTSGPGIGPASDIFSLAGVVFRMLTGEDYFQANSTLDGVLLAQEDKRRSVTECRALYPDLREREPACAAIDRLLAHATAFDPRHRPQTAWEFAASVLRALRPEPTRHRPPRRRLESISDTSDVSSFSWGWHVRSNPGSDRVIRSVAWDGDGRCLAATSSGLAFWNGTSWADAPLDGLPIPKGIRFVRRVGPGQWLVGGDQATIAHYSRDGVSHVLRAEDESVSFTEASGEIGDLAVLVGARPDESPLLFSLAAHRWLKPAALLRAQNVTSLSRVSDDGWLLCGRSRAGNGFAAIYSPLMFDVRRLPSSDVAEYTSSTAQQDLGLGVVVGSKGRVLTIQGGEARESVVPGEPDLSSVVLDIGGRLWAASLGALWLFSEPVRAWTCVWREPRWASPFVSLFADVGWVIGLTEDGAVVEGRWEPKNRARATSRPRLRRVVTK